MGPSSWPGAVLPSLLSGSQAAPAYPKLWPHLSPERLGPWGTGSPVRLLKETPASFSEPIPVCKDSRSSLPWPWEQGCCGFLSLGLGLKE